MSLRNPEPPQWSRFSLSGSISFAGTGKPDTIEREGAGLDCTWLGKARHPDNCRNLREAFMGSQLSNQATFVGYRDAKDDSMHHVDDPTHEAIRMLDALDDEGPCGHRS